VRPTLVVDWAQVEPLVIDPAQTPISADIAPAVGGATDMSRVHVIDLEKLPEGFRLQRLTFQAARKAFAAMEGQFRGTQEYLVLQLIRLVEQFFDSDRLDIPSIYHQDRLRKRILFALNIDVIVQHLLRHVNEQNAEHLEPVFDEEAPIGSTRQMRTWYTTKHCIPTARSQISHAVADSSWEQYAANALEKSSQVAAYAKNDHLGFQVLYMWNGSRRRFVPDYLIRLNNGKTLVLEIKGEDSEQNRAKRAALDAWVQAVSQKGGFGRWAWDVALEPAQIHDLLGRHSAQ